MGSDSSKSAVIGTSVNSPTGYRRLHNAAAPPSSLTSSSPAAVPEGVPRGSSNEITGSDSSTRTSPQCPSQNDEDTRRDSVSSLMSLSSYVVPTSTTTSVGSKGDRAKSAAACPPPSPFKKLGLWNVGNTCYTNSVLQVLYENSIFRECCENELGISDGDGLLNSLAQLFVQISGAKKARRTAHISPNKFIQRLKEKNSIFRSPDHHDAHEFYSYLMNVIGEELLQRKEETTVETPPTSQTRKVSIPNGTRTPTSRWYSKKASTVDSTESHRSQASSPSTSPCQVTSKRPAAKVVSDLSFPPQPTTWLHELFQGYLVYETRCLCCENITRRREPCLDIPLDIEADNAGNLSTCIRHFARTELLKGKVRRTDLSIVKDKYFCDICGCLQEAERSLRFERLPRVLTIHLKRFKYDETRGCYSRVASKVEFPATLYFPADALARDHPCHSNRIDSSYDRLSARRRSSLDSPEKVSAREMARRGSEVGENRDHVEHCSFPRKNVDKKDLQSKKSRQTGLEFDLSGVVVHIGTTMSHGHYISCVKSDDHSWWLYDDHNVKPISSDTLSSFYGSSDRNVGAQCGYLLFYTSRVPFPFKQRTRSSGSRWPQLIHSLTFKRSTAANGSHTDDTVDGAPVAHTTALPSSLVPSSISFSENTGDTDPLTS